MQTGVRLRQRYDNSIAMPQEEYVKSIDKIELSGARKKEKDQEASEGEKSQLRATLGAIG